jgi:hypothetical protein
MPVRSASAAHRQGTRDPNCHLCQRLLLKACLLCVAVSCCCCCCCWQHRINHRLRQLGCLKALGLAKSKIGMRMLALLLMQPCSVVVQRRERAMPSRATQNTGNLTTHSCSRFHVFHVLTNTTTVYLNVRSEYDTEDSEGEEDWHDGDTPAGAAASRRRDGDLYGAKHASVGKSAKLLPSMMKSATKLTTKVQTAIN